MKLFFIIPVYKTEAYLARCIESVLGQTAKNVAIVLVDDGSPDTSPALCDAYAAKYENVVALHKENGGLSDARNYGLAYVSEKAEAEDFVTFLDSDDFVHPDFAERMLALCAAHGADAAQCGYEKGAADTFSEPQKEDAPVIKSGAESLLYGGMKSQSCAKVYKADIFDGITFPKGVWNEDEFTTWRAIYRARRVVMTEEKLYYYYQHPGSIMSDIANKLKDHPRAWDFMRAYEERIAFFEKEGDLTQVMRTHEKICTDLILRYAEQMQLPKEARNTAASDGTYVRLYRESFGKMIKRRGIPLPRRLMYIAFYVWPTSAVLPGKIFGLRK